MILLTDLPLVSLFTLLFSWICRLKFKHKVNACLHVCGTMSFVTKTSFNIMGFSYVLFLKAMDIVYEEPFRATDNPNKMIEQL